jgi:triose/dihydroxyacetone kinase / FAD-AMP lyase (cyclizing)
VGLPELVSSCLRLRSYGSLKTKVFAIFFTAWSSALQKVKSPQDIASSLSDALEALSAHTPAQPGDRTLVDALQPLVLCLKAGDTLGEAVSASREGAERTRHMKPRLGRAAYVGGIGDNLPADPGAVGIAIIADGFWRGLEV